MMMNNLSAAAAAREREEEEGGKAVETGGASSSYNVEKEHMFDKVVTPSDVGKLNRLVIPKQHAERFFPLDSSSTEKGLLLNFEDRTGKPWRFRYSYWNSSQSYVMTKGWSRFVKDKKLDAGDIVSFQRAVVAEIGGTNNNNSKRLFIDWRRRPKAPDPTTSMFPRFYAFPQPLLTIPRNYGDFQNLNHHNSFNLSYQHRHHYQFPRDLGFRYGDSVGRYQIRSLERDPAAVVIDSVPVIQGRNLPAVEAVTAVSGKRLRLFGVDMDCGMSTNGWTDQDEYSSSSSGSVPRGAMATATATAAAASSSSLSSLQLRLASSEESSMVVEAADDHHHFSKKGKSSSSSFDNLHR